MFIKILIITIVLFGFAFLLLGIGLLLDKSKGMKGHSCGVNIDGNDVGGACSMCGLKDIMDRA